MNTPKRLNNLGTVLALASCLLLLDPLSASLSSRHSGEGVCQAGESSMVTVSGTVIETMNGGGYTYALVKKDGDKTWVALPSSKIALGNEITCRPGMVMNNFGSTALRRTFDNIVFSSGLVSISAGSEAQTTPGTNEAQDTEVETPKPKPVEDWGNF